MNLKPIGDRIVIQRLAADEKTSGGIILPDSAQKKPAKGKVIAVGPGRVLKDGTRRGLQIKAGDVVLFTNWAGEEFKKRQTGDELLVMHEGDVLAVLE